MKKKRKKTAGAKSRDKARSQNTGKNKQLSGSGSALHVALRLAAEDVPLVPRYGKVDGRCTCGNENCERPRRHSPSGISTADASADPQVIRRWWKKWPGTLPGIVIGGVLGIIAVVSEGAAGEATARKLRKQGKIFKKTVTIRDHQRKIRLYYAWGSDVPYGTQLGDGLRLLDAGEIVKGPSRLQGGDSIQFLDGRAPGEISLTSVPDWLVERTNRVDERLPNDEAKLNVRPPADPRQLDPRFEDGEIRVDDVLIRPDHDEVDDEVVTAIAESPSGPFNPIIVRRLPPEEQPEPGAHKVELIRGRQRLEAARLRGMETIKCRFFSGTAAAARLIALEEDLFRKKLTALQKAERLVEWAEQLRKTGFYISGQVVRKKRGKSWITRAMRQLPVVGRSIEARCMEFKRSMKIAAIVPEAKRIIVSFRALADNKTALKAIARESGRSAQVRKAKEFAEKAQELRQMAKPKPSRVAGDKSQDHAEEESPPLQPNSAGQTEESPDANDTDDEANRPAVPKDTTREELMAAWKQADLPKLWKYTPGILRSEFMDMLGRARCAAKADVLEFARNVFSGRELVYTRELYAFAKKNGISKKWLPVAARSLEYKLTKVGRAPQAPRAYRAKRSEWKNQVKVISDGELEAALRAEQDLAQQDSDILDELPLDPQKEAYYTDI